MHARNRDGAAEGFIIDAIEAKTDHVLQRVVEGQRILPHISEMPPDLFGRKLPGVLTIEQISA